MIHQYCHTLPRLFHGNPRTTTRPGDTVLIPGTTNTHHYLLCIAWTSRATGLTSHLPSTSDSVGHQVHYPALSCTGPKLSSAIIRCLSNTATSLSRVPTENAVRVSLVYPSKFRHLVPSTTVGPRVAQLLEGKVIAAGFEINCPAGGLKDFTLVVRATQPSACAVRMTSTTRVVVSWDEQPPPVQSMVLQHTAHQSSSSPHRSPHRSPPRSPSRSRRPGRWMDTPLEGPAQEIRELLLAPVMWSKKLDSYHVQLPRGILLSGPPGVGKTRSVRLACQSCRVEQTGINVQLFTINGADLFATNQVGGAAAVLRSVFQKARRHVEGSIYAVSCIFIDEIDVVCPSRDRGDGGNGNTEVVRVVAQLLTLLDGVGEEGVSKMQLKARERVLICAATNRPNVLDAALRRPGRFDHEIHFKPPTVQERTAILKSFVRLPEVPKVPKVPAVARPSILSTLPSASTAPPPTWFSQLTRFYKHVGDPMGKNGVHKSAKTNVVKVLQKYKDQEKRLFEELFRRYTLSNEDQATYNLELMEVEVGEVGEVAAEDPQSTTTTTTTTTTSSASSSPPLPPSAKPIPRGVPIASDVVLFDVATLCVGYTGADLQALVRESAMHAIASNRTCVTKEDISAAMTTITPSSMRGHTVHKRQLRWDELGGLATAKLEIQKAIVWPLQRAATFARLGAAPPRGILLHGPPGCGKTSLVLALANDIHATFLTMTPSDVYSAYVGDSESSIRAVFARARSCVPALLFLDEMDAIVGSRGLEGGNGTGGGGGGGASDVQARVLSTLLNEMDGISSADGLIIVGATNRLDAIDPALLRPGRFGRHVKVGLPTLDERIDILQVSSQHIPMSKQIDLVAIGQATPLWSGAELRGLCREAAMCALRNDVLEITQQDMETALNELLQTKQHER